MAGYLPVLGNSFQDLENMAAGRQHLNGKIIGTRLALLFMVFHRILDFKTGCISMPALFLL
jgi:hypothetical protein